MSQPRSRASSSVRPCAKSAARVRVRVRVRVRIRVRVRVRLRDRVVANPNLREESGVEDHGRSEDEEWEVERRRANVPPLE